MTREQMIDEAVRHTLNRHGMSMFLHPRVDIVGPRFREAAADDIRAEFRRIAQETH